MRIKITVLKKILNEDVAEKYCEPGTSICESFEEGQEFLLNEIECPEGFCAWAWDDLHKGVVTLYHRGRFDPYMKQDNLLISCCTDGIRPVVFKIERIEE